MNRTENRERWERIAAGDDDSELLSWLKGVAQAILEADNQPARNRPNEIVRAVGLFGKKDDQARLRMLVELVDSFPFISDEGEVRKPDHGERMRILIVHARSFGLVEHDVSDPELRKRIERTSPR